MADWKFIDDESKQVEPLFAEVVARLKAHKFDAPDHLRINIELMKGPVHILSSGQVVDASSRFLKVHDGGITIDNALDDIVQEIQSDLVHIKTRYSDEALEYVYAPYMFMYCDTFTDSGKEWKRYIVRAGKHVDLGKELE